MKKLLLLIMLGMLILPLVSAEEIIDTSKTLNPFGAEKIIIASPTSYLAYPEIRLSKTFFWIETDKIAEYKLTNIECGFTTCNMDYLVTTYIDETLFDDKLVVTDMKTGKDIELEYAEYFIKDGTEEYEGDVNVITKVNESSSISTTKKQILTRDKWVKYDFTEKRAGTYEVRLTGEIKAGASVDVKPYAQNREFTEHAEWTSAFNTNLLAYYNFEEGAGTTVGNVANESLGDFEFQANHFPSWENGKIGKGLRLNGTAVAINTTGNYLNVLGSFSLSVWAYTNATHPDNGAIVSRTTANNAGGGFAIGTTAVSPQGVFLSSYDTTYHDLALTNPIIDNSWVNYILVHDTDANTIRIYINGADKGTVEYNPTVNTLQATIGRFPYLDSADRYFQGGIDEYGYWNRILTAQEILDLNSSITYTDDFRKISANHSYPIQSYNTTINLVNIGCNFTANVLNNLSSVKLNVYDSSNNLDYTNTDTGSYGVSYNKSWTTSALTDDTYNWACYAYGDGGLNASTTNRTFKIDTTNPILDLIYPTSAYIVEYPNENISLNYSVSDSNIQRCWYNTDYNPTNTYLTCGVNSTVTYPPTNPLTLSIRLYANDSLGLSANENVTISRSIVPPTISIHTPTGNQGIRSLPYNVTLNYTASDTNLQSCWYNTSLSAILVYTPCNITNITSITSAGTQRIYVYANDSFGNEHVNFTSFYPSATYSNATFNTITTEGTIENFKLYILSSTIPTINSIIYNGTSYNGNIVSLGSDNYLLNNSIIIPLVVSQQNVSFLWNVTFADSSTAVTPYYNQTINNFGVDNCTAGSFLLFNFSLYDEDSKAFLNGGTENTSIKLDLNFYNYGTTTLLTNYSKSVPFTNPVRICLASQINSSRYTLDGVIQYSSTNRFPEFYNIKSYTIDNSSYNTQIPLYDLNTSTGTEFKITYKDSNFIPVVDALIYIQRKYIEEGLFRTVEIPKTGADGTALGKFVRNDAIYNLIFVKNGVTLATFSNIIPVCQNPTVYNCEINLNSLGSGTIPSDYSNVDGLSFTLTYNKTTRTVSSTYSITSGVPEVVTLNLTVNDALGTTLISSDSLNSAGGTLSVNIPETFGNGTVIAKIYKSNDLVGNALINIYQDPQDIYGGSWLFIALFAIIFIVGMAVSDNPMVYGASLVLGFAMLIMMNIVYSPSIIGVGATILYLVIGIIIIMMKGSERN